VGALVGKLTAINTVGAVFGSLVAGYVLLPALGSERSLLVVAGCFGVGAAYATLTLETRLEPSLKLVGVALALAIVLPRWDLGRLTAGTNVYFDGAQKTDELLMLREDVQGGVTSVAQADGVRTLYTNGKFQGNTGWEMNAQRYFAHYPSLFVPRFEQALVIGLGTGTTTGTLAAYPWRNIEVVEISPAIVDAAQRYFAEVNDHVLADRRVELVIADGRNHLLLTDKQYDLVSIELSSIWFAGASSLYSSEFYELVSERLAPGGVLQQWVQLHHILPRDFATILHTMRERFEHMVLFFGGGQGILVASQRPLQASQSRAERFERDPRLWRTIPEVRDASGNTTRRGLFSLLNDALVANEGLDAYVSQVARKAGEPVASLVSTDDNLYLEYATPRGNVLDWSARDELIQEILRFRSQTQVDILRAK
jgi:spermidine synthase